MLKIHTFAERKDFWNKLLKSNTMKKTFVICSALLLSLSIFSQKKNDNATTLKTANDSLSYAFGQLMAESFVPLLDQMKIIQPNENNDKKIEQDNAKALELLKKGLKSTISDDKKEAYNTGIALGFLMASQSQGIESQVLKDEKVNLNIAIQAVNDVLDKDAQMSEAGQFLNSYIENKKLQESQKAKDEALKKEADFFVENAKKAGVISLPNGIQYKVITQGSGEKPTANDQVEVNYEGKLLDGTVFDSSYERGEPITFGVTQVIPGWTHILQQMPVGSKWIVYIPQELAYGDRDMGQIPPYSTLEFTIELLGIEK